MSSLGCIDALLLRYHPQTNPEHPELLWASSLNQSPREHVRSTLPCSQHVPFGHRQLPKEFIKGRNRLISFKDHCDGWQLNADRFQQTKHVFGDRFTVTVDKHFSIRAVAGNMNL